MKKIIFLDFDGVLNTEYNQNLLMYHGKSWKDKYGAFFDPETVAELKRIVEETNADIVIESSWKSHHGKLTISKMKVGMLLSMMNT